MARPLGLFRILLFYTTLLNTCISTWAIDENDFRFILFKDVSKESSRFAQHDIVDYSKLVFDYERDQVLVGARDYLLRLSLSNLSLIQSAPVPPTYFVAQNCMNKGQSEESCRNHVRVLLRLEDGESLLVCGTNAYFPQCCVRQITDLTKSSEWTRAVGVCPYSPLANSSSILVSEPNAQPLLRNRAGFVSNRDRLALSRDAGSNGGFLGKQVLYAGAAMDFSGQDAAIYRTDLANGKSSSQPSLRTHQYDPHWLNDPQFVGSFEDESYVYFLFREVAVEYINCGKVIYSRIARVCKNDSGGQSMMRDNWTSFLKARLNCSRPGEHPFYFDEIQDMAYDEQEKVVYAIFTTPVNSIAGSAICSFNMSAVQTSFSGAYKHQATPTSQWEAKMDDHPECGSNKVPRYQLMDQPVQPNQKEPLHQVELERYTNMAIDKVDTKHHTGVRVIFVSNDQNEVKKISILSRTGKACVIDVFRLEEKNGVVGGIREMEFDKFMNSLYILTRTSVWRVPVEQCTRLKTEKTCLDSMNPYCGWDKTAYGESGRLGGACTKAPDGDPLNHSWKQNPIECPQDTKRQQPQWSEWSEWTKCAQASENNIDSSEFEDSQQDWCLCQTRTCLGVPSNRGSNSRSKPGSAPTECRGPSTRIANCTRHGAWTAWSPWSACSQTCGVAVKTRRRSCSAPAPAHGGRVCVGPESHEIYCADNPPCPTQRPNLESQEDDLKSGRGEGDIEIGGESSWSTWSSWSSCSAQCSGGFRVRRRVCSSSQPSSSGLVRRPQLQSSSNVHARAHAHPRAQTHAHALSRAHARARPEDEGESGTRRRRRRRDVADGGDADSGDVVDGGNQDGVPPGTGPVYDDVHNQPGGRRHDGHGEEHQHDDVDVDLDEHAHAHVLFDAVDAGRRIDISYTESGGRRHDDSDIDQDGEIDQDTRSPGHIDTSGSSRRPIQSDIYSRERLVDGTDAESGRGHHDDSDVDQDGEIDQNSYGHEQSGSAKKHGYPINSGGTDAKSGRGQHKDFDVDQDGEIDQDTYSSEHSDRSSNIRSPVKPDIKSREKHIDGRRRQHHDVNIDQDGEIDQNSRRHEQSGLAKKHGHPTDSRRRQHHDFDVDQDNNINQDINPSENSHSTTGQQSEGVRNIYFSEYGEYGARIDSSLEDNKDKLKTNKGGSRKNTNTRINFIEYNVKVAGGHKNYDLEDSENRRHGGHDLGRKRSKRSFNDDFDKDPDDTSSEETLSRTHRHTKHKQNTKSSTCPGSDIEYETCNEHPCQMHRKFSAWTQWFPVKNDTTTFHRFRYMCTAPVPAASRIKFSMREERKVRDISDSLDFADEDYLVSEMEHEAEFESKLGRDRRVNKDGLISERKTERDMRMSGDENDKYPDCDENISVVRASVMILALSCTGAFLLGATCTGGIILYKLRHGSLDVYSKRRVRVPSSPHYVTQQPSKQNSYVSVPLREMSVKRQSSFSGRTNTLHKTNNISSNQCATPKLYPKAICSEINSTLKRGSGSANADNVMNNRDQDKFY